MSFPKGLTFPVSIPWVPPSLNLMLRMNRWNRAGLRQLAGQHLVAAGLPRQQYPTNHRVRVTIQMYRKRPMDRDNAAGALKVLFDALKDFGYMRDDSEEWADLIVLPVIVDRKRARTEITIESA